MSNIYSVNLSTNKILSCAAAAKSYKKAPTWPRDVFFERGPLRRAGARTAVLALAGRAAHRRVPDAAARAPATPAASGARV
jgi:hypothetical protein